MMLLNIDYIPGKNFEVLGLVDGSVVQAKGPMSDFLAGLEAFAGGEVTEYTELLAEARQTAVERMMNVAESLGADAVINIRYSTSEVSQGAAEIVAYGTAVKFV